MNQVWRVGDAVHRKATAATPTIHKVLAHARLNGVDWVPTPLGIDDNGVERLSFVVGVVPHDVQPWIWAESVLVDVAKALRQWHDATLDFPKAESIWNLPIREPKEVICHNDFATYNCVFLGEKLSGVIDFDMCSPGPRLWDIAYTCYSFIPLRPSNVDVVDSGQDRGVETVQPPVNWQSQCARLERFLEWYSGGVPTLRYSVRQTLETTAERLEVLAVWTDRFADESRNSALTGHARAYRMHAEWLWDRSVG